MYKLYTILAIIVCVTISSCSTKDKKKSLLNTDQLQSDTLRIDVTRDTQLVTRKGAVINIPKGSLSTTTGSIAELEIKEAYSIQDMLLAGLSTTSNGQLLSSGGMFYINSIGENKTSIIKPVSVSIPTPFINKNMSQFKGVVKEDRAIDWTDPKPLAANPQQLQIDTGKKLFQINCAPCHAIGNPGTGPDLGHIVKRSPGWQNIWGEEDSDTLHTHKVNLLYEWTLNWNRAASQNPYYFCMKNWSPIAQTVFENNLNYHDLDMLYAYIENESYLKNLPLGDTTLPSCYDSCLIYKELKERLQSERYSLVEKSRSEIEERYFSTRRAANEDTSINRNPIAPNLDMVDPSKNKYVYYKLTIETFGWTNIDIMMKNFNDAVESTLTIRVKEEFYDKVDIYLAIPSYKAVTKGGLLDDPKGSLGFNKILLPQQINATVIATTEIGDKLYLGLESFTTTQKLEISLTMQEVSKETFNKKISQLDFKDFKLQATDSKNADTIRNYDKQLKNLDKFKPTRCNCDCITSPSKTDETPLPISESYSAPKAIK